MEGATSASLGTIAKVNDAFGFVQQTTPNVKKLVETTSVARDMVSTLASNPEALRDLASELGDLLPELQDVAIKAFDVVSDFAGAIPVAGAFIKLWLAAAQVMVGVTQRFIAGLGLGKGPPDPITSIRTDTYSPELDTQQTSSIIALSASASWSAAFCPEVVKPVGSAVFKGQSGLDMPDTKEVRVYGDQTLAGARGFIPGLIRRFDELSWGVTTPYTIVRPEGVQIDQRIATSSEYLLPGERCVASQLWSQLNSNTPDCFKIDNGMLRALWFLNFCAMRKMYSKSKFSNPTSGMTEPSRAYSATPWLFPIQNNPKAAIYRTETANASAMLGIQDRLYPIAIVETTNGKRVVLDFSDPEALDLQDTRNRELAQARESMRLDPTGDFSDWLLNRLDSTPSDLHLAFNTRGYEDLYDPSSCKFGKKLSRKSSTRRMMRVSIYYWIDYCLEKWEENCIANAQTLNAAYIDERFPALRNRKVLEHVNRTKLKILVAKNIHEVDLSMVVDPDFRAAIIQQRERKPQGPVVDVFPGRGGSASDPNDRIRGETKTISAPTRTKARHMGSIYVPGLTVNDIIDAGGAFEEGGPQKPPSKSSAVPLLLAAAGAGLFFMTQKR